MSEETLRTTEEERSAAFFDRIALAVAVEISERVFILGLAEGRFPKGAPKVIRIPGAGGDKSFKVTLVEAYTEEDMEALGLYSRLEKIRSMRSGEVVAFAYRAGLLSFIKTRGGENILIRELEDFESGERTRSLSQVTKTLGLEKGEMGKFIFDGENLTFSKIN